MAERTANDATAKGAAAVSLLCSVLLMVAWLGRPPYAFYAFLRPFVGLGALYAAACLYGRRRAFGWLAALAAAVAFGKMHRAQWGPIDAAAIVAFAVAAGFMLQRPAEGP